MINLGADADQRRPGYKPWPGFFPKAITPTNIVEDTDRLLDECPEQWEDGSPQFLIVFFTGQRNAGRWGDLTAIDVLRWLERIENY